MPLRDFSKVNYVPLLSVRPAEMRALEELPERDKDQLFPFMFLRPWTTAHHLDSSLSKIEEAYGSRPIIMDAGFEEPTDGAERPVHHQLRALRDSSFGYSNWCEFVRQRDLIVPSLQITDLEEITEQARQLAQLDRGLVVRIPQQAFAVSRDIARMLGGVYANEKICFLIDYERQSRELLTRVAASIGIARGIFSELPGCYISLSASSFPDSFVSIAGQDIYERQFFNEIERVIGAGKLIYSDRGSARAERQGGGGGQPAPRVDYAGPSAWAFFREDEGGDRDEAYRDASVRAMNSPLWDPRLRVWGSQMIERTALRDPNAISSPMRATAVRINIHLHRQLFYGRDPEEMYDTDEEWDDL